MRRGRGLGGTAGGAQRLGHPQRGDRHRRCRRRRAATPCSTAAMLAAATAMSPARAASQACRAWSGTSCSRKASRSQRAISPAHCAAVGSGCSALPAVSINSQPRSRFSEASVRASAALVSIAGAGGEAVGPAHDERAFAHARTSATRRRTPRCAGAPGRAGRDRGRWRRATRRRAAWGRLARPRAPCVSSITRERFVPAAAAALHVGDEVDGAREIDRHHVGGAQRLEGAGPRSAGGIELAEIRRGQRPGARSIRSAASPRDPSRANRARPAAAPAPGEPGRSTAARGAASSSMPSARPSRPTPRMQRRRRLEVLRRLVQAAVVGGVDALGVAALAPRSRRSSLATRAPARHRRCSPGNRSRLPRSWRRRARKKATRARCDGVCASGASARRSRRTRSAGRARSIASAQSNSRSKAASGGRAPARSPRRGSRPRAPRGCGRAARPGAPRRRDAAPPRPRRRRSAGGAPAAPRSRRAARGAPRPGRAAPARSAAAAGRCAASPIRSCMKPRASSRPWRSSACQASASSSTSRRLTAAASSGSKSLPATAAMRTTSRPSAGKASSRCSSSSVTRAGASSLSARRWPCFSSAWRMVSSRCSGLPPIRRTSAAATAGASTQRQCQRFDEGQHGRRRSSGCSATAAASLRAHKAAMRAVATSPSGREAKPKRSPASARPLEQLLPGVDARVVGELQIVEHERAQARARVPRAAARRSDRRHRLHRRRLALARARTVWAMKRRVGRHRAERRASARAGDAPGGRAWPAAPCRRPAGRAATSTPALRLGQGIEQPALARTRPGR